MPLLFLFIALGMAALAGWSLAPRYHMGAVSAALGGLLALALMYAGRSVPPLWHWLPYATTNIVVSGVVYFLFRAGFSRPVDPKRPLPLLPAGSWRWLVFPAAAPSLLYMYAATTSNSAIAGEWLRLLIHWLMLSMVGIIPRIIDLNAGRHISLGVATIVTSLFCVAAFGFWADGSSDRMLSGLVALPGVFASALIAAYLFWGFVLAWSARRIGNFLSGAAVRRRNARG